jgi:phosphatidylserine/phosphatidylglycerophosphate/cardiolipin synthase-like enzyme
MRTRFRLPRWTTMATGVIALCGLHAAPASAQEQLFFPWRDNVKNVIIQKINNENVRIDIATWYLTSREITNALVNRHRAGVTVRVIGDRVSIFEIDANTRREFEFLATNGVPIRLRYNPTSFPFIMHWKSGLFVGQGIFEFGSANWTTFELEPESATNYKDETAMFTDDTAIVAAARSRFDQFWADTTNFLDWPVAYERETGQPWTAPMTIDRTRLEPDVAGPSTMIWEQGTVLNNRMTTEINAETQGIDMVLYRLTVPNITSALVNRLNAGVPVRIIVEPTQYRQKDWPEYELTRARVDQLWVAGAQIKKRVHQGLTHMKVLITSRYGMHGSSNFTKNWQRDHNYFIPSLTKPALYNTLRDEFDRMWADDVNYGDFYPEPPAAPALRTPADLQTGVSTTPRLEWNRSFWAVAFDVYMGTSSSNMTFQGRVNASLTENPPATYSFTPSVALQPGTRYFWKVVARTFAADVDPSLVAHSATRSFTTTGTGGGGGGSGPFGGTPAPLPGTIQAENFDEGGQAVAYNDASAGNSGGKYRSTDVDIENTGDAGGGFNVGWMSVGEWLKYTVNVTAAGTYDLEFRLASAGGGGTFHLESNGTNKTGTLSIPNTGGWQNWTTVRATGVSLASGQQVFRIVMDSAGPSGAVMNLNHIRVVSNGEPPPPPPPPAPEIVIYAADVPDANLHGNWGKAGDATAAAGVKLQSNDLGGATLGAPLASPTDYVDVTFQAEAGVRYRLWLRVNAENDSKWNDSMYVQFSGAVNASGTPIYRIGTTQGLNVNQATCSSCVPAGWGWHNGAYWLPDTGEVRFAATGTQTMRIQIREDGVRLDQIVLSPTQYLTTAPGPKTNDTTIVPKP